MEERVSNAEGNEAEDWLFVSSIVATDLSQGKLQKRGGRTTILNI